MDTRFLKTLLIASETGSLAETARLLNVTPSAVMQRIKALEASLGCALLKRSGHRMQPTAFALALRDRARQMLDLENELHDVCGGELRTGDLRIGVIGTAATGLFPDILVEAGKSLPRLTLHLVPGTSLDLYPQVLSREVDAAAIVKPPFQLPKSMEWRTLRREPLVVVASAEHANADPMTLLRTQPYIRYDRNHWGGRLAEKCLRGLRISPRVAHELDSLDAITIMVSHGIGISLIPDWCPPWPQGVAVEKFPFAGAPVREIGLLWTRGSSCEHLVEALLGLCVQR